MTTGYLNPPTHHTTVDVSFLNPWWWEEEWWEVDPHLTRWEESRYKWIPLWVEKLNHEPFSLHFVLGPRQSGKTTGIKLFVRKLMEGGVDPSTITYVNVEVFPDTEKFYEWLREYTEEHPTSKRLLILDEVTHLEGWWRPVKVLIDAGLFKNVTIVATGSASLLLKKDTELFPGRRGGGTTVHVLPLSFRDVLEIKRGHPRALCEWYLNHGGFPRVINDDYSVYAELIEGIKRDVLLLGKDPSLAVEILQVVAQKAPSELSYASIAKELNTSHSVIREYTYLLQEMYVLRIVRRYGKHGSRKMKKFVVRDVGYTNLLVDVPLPVRLEWVVQEHVGRKYGEVYYEKRNGETDVVANGLKVEVGVSKEGKNVVNLKNCHTFMKELLAPSVKPVRG